MDGGTLFCGLCNMRFSGVIPYQSHIQGQKHQKKLKDKALVETFGNVLRLDSNSEGSQTAEINEALSSLRCSVCDKSFSGPTPLKQHLESFVHQKKVAQRKALDNLGSSTPMPSLQGLTALPYSYQQPSLRPSGSFVQIPRDKLSCGTCGMKFDTFEETLEHYESDEHREHRMKLKVVGAEQQENEGTEVDNSKTATESMGALHVKLEAKILSTVKVNEGKANFFPNMLENAPSGRQNDQIPSSNIIIIDDDDKFDEILGAVMTPGSNSVPK